MSSRSKAHNPGQTPPRSCQSGTEPGALAAMPHITDSGLVRLTSRTGDTRLLGYAVRAPHLGVYRSGCAAGVAVHPLSAAKYKFRCQTVANSSLKEIHIRVLQEPCPSPVLLFQLWFGPRLGSRSGGEWGPDGGLVDGEAKRSSGHGESKRLRCST